jgi:phosphate transport system substrate-binding protein
MRPIPLVLLLGLALAQPAGARDAPWIVAPAALAGVAADFAGPAARIEAREDDEAAVTAYCSGLGAQAADALILPRRLLDRERRGCAGEAISPEPERVLGLAGLAVEGSPAALSRRHLWRALAREVSSDDGKLEPNRVRSWREVDPSFLDRPIAFRLEAPAPLVEELVLAIGCLGAAGYAKLDRARLCRSLREDLPSGPAPLVIRPLNGGGDAVEGIAPAATEISSGRYPLARRLYLYAKRAHLPGIPGLAELLHRETPGLAQIP